ncbi:DinB family protein [Pedobacter mucosus]|uniref:DinB family protein n=1 Tax=Pedobacter mucosus TaxID=2895286 RepID=UPI001EE3E830|nr:DinB family protein [Pedobacter mucosus]UKT65261.1 DinB family protein [Pedobacter mucosus]
MKSETEIIVAELIKLLKGGGAHVGLQDATKDVPFHLLGERPHQLPYSIWQLTEHIRIAQWDMLEFSKDANYKSIKWPDDYWPKETSPTDETIWNNTLFEIERDLNEFILMIQNQNIFDPILHGNGQSILREALQVADHNAYHIGEIIVIRRLLGAWK